MISHFLFISGKILIPIDRASQAFLYFFYVLPRYSVFRKNPTTAPYLFIINEAPRCKQRGITIKQGELRGDKRLLRFHQTYNRVAILRYKRFIRLKVDRFHKTAKIFLGTRPGDQVNGQ